MANSQCFFYQCNTKFDSNVSMTYCHILLRVLLQKLDRLRFCCRTLPVVEKVDTSQSFVAGCMFFWLVYMQFGVEHRMQASVEGSRSCNAMKKAVFD